jgi:Na+/pantothenate symporter
LLFPEIALNHLSTIPAIIFLLGIIAATFATTDSALTALTTSFCVDFLGMGKVENSHKQNTVRKRHIVHISFSALIFLVILIFNSINDSSVVGMIFKVASYTYGPLLGLYAFGLFQKSRNVNDKLVPFICLLAPFLTYIINENSKILFSGYVFDNELIVLNGLLTYLGLFLTSSHSIKKISF